MDSGCHLLQAPYEPLQKGLLLSSAAAKLDPYEAVPAAGGTASSPTTTTAQPSAGAASGFASWASAAAPGHCSGAMAAAPRRRPSTFSTSAPDSWCSVPCFRHHWLAQHHCHDWVGQCLRGCYAPPTALRHGVRTARSGEGGAATCRRQQNVVGAEAAPRASHCHPSSAPPSAVVIGWKFLSRSSIHQSL
ncbi:UNVERIFIED_CONTAM: hypothetical protein K2H54_046295 [Gekko kuhli]